ncbi:LytR/AlgR family response regulator transcription factor [Latilactobacillus sakei]|uniref:LytR/AlgR family response regulator transcription factor n=1 Tax=Latilactobacillus sakei TaxID=1599 RepID=UPI000C125A48|nr:LytTR family DNA-binding domain-containing protein [Latilactobacillus sakei]UNC16891.1 response regulator transcription factor [Latilactobacillus sakei]SON69860.1 Two-component system, response regulator [Latilactobacillus sakei]
MLNIAFCDDNQCFLKKITQEIDRSLAIKATYQTFTNATDLLDAFKPGVFDALFIDIYMPKINGKMLAHKIRNLDKRVKIIFVTRYEQEILNTLQYDIYDFLPKDHLSERIDNLLARLSRSVAFENNKYLRLKLRETTGEELYKKVYLDDIIYVESLNRKVYLHLADQTQFELIGYTFQEITDSLVEKGFLRTHRKFSVNLIFINEIKNTSILMDNGEELDLSRRRKKEVQEAFICGIRGILSD